MKMLEYTFLYHRYDYKTDDVTEEYCSVEIDDSSFTEKNYTRALIQASEDCCQDEKDLEFVESKFVNSDDIDLPF